jgi:hypothetical protein
MIAETIDYKGYEIEICYDEMAMNPRTEFDNLGHMVCFHKRYNLGDENHDYDSNDFDSWDELEDAIYQDNDVCVCLPIYMYDHSGLAINTTGFSCPWDSGQIGFIFIDKQTIRKEYGVKRISKKLRQRIEKYLIGEVETYDNYLSGSVFGYQIKETEEDEILDSCWGFYGYNHEQSGLLEYAKNAIDYHIEQENKKQTQLPLPFMVSNENESVVNNSL